MPRNAGGVYAPTASSFNPAVNNTIISPTDWNALLVDLTAALNSIPYISIAARPQRRVTSAAALPIVATDSIINLSISAPLAVTIPLASTRAGNPLTFKDVSGTVSGAQTVTLNRTSGDTFDGQTSIVLNVNYQSITLVPANDGTTTGWSIE